MKVILTDGNEVFAEKIVASAYEAGILAQEAVQATGGNVFWTIAKNEVKYVAVNRAEGPHEECKAVVFYTGDKPQVFEDTRHFKNAAYVPCDGAQAVMVAVRRQFSKWGDTAPDVGYDKCDFEVGWADGLVYGGRFDMQKGGTDGRESFWANLRSRLEFYALRRRPAHFKDEHWKHFCEQMRKDGGDQYCGRILDECEMAA